MAQEWYVDSFERGFTDTYVAGPRNAGQIYENLLISRNRKPYQRPGSNLYDADLDSIPPGNVRIQHLKLHENILFEFTGDEIHYRDTTWQELIGPVNSYDAFGGIGDPDTNHNATAVWQKHLFATIDEFSRARKIYKDENDDWQIRTVGLPSIGDVNGLNSAIALANDIRSKYNAHVADTAEHLLSDTAITSPVASSLETLIALVNEIKDLYILHEADARLVTPLKHLASVAVDYSLDEEGSVSNLDDAIVLLNDLRAKYQDHDANTTSHNVGAQHQLAVAAASRLFTVTPESADGAAYIYNLVYKYQYQVGTVIYEVRSAPTEVLVENAGDFSTSAKGNDLSAIPTLTNTTFGTQEAWDTASIVVEIYRTSDGGTESFKVAEIPNGTSTYDDGTNDDDLLEGIQLYTDGGIVGNIEPPPCKYLIQANDIMWYLHVKEGNEERPFRVRHSLQFQPDSSPDDFTVDIDGDITGGGAIGIYPIVFTKNKVFRLEGSVDNFGRGFVKKRIVDDTVGSVSHNSIVSVQDGLYFAALDGFYFTDGFKTTKISNHLDESYLELVSTDEQQKRIYGSHDAQSGLIYWAVQSDSTLTENDKLWVHDPSWGIPNGEGTFTTWDFGDNGSPTALEFDEGSLIRADALGYTFLHDQDVFSDPVINVLAATADWEKTAVIYRYKSCAYDFGSTFQRKWVTKLLFLLKAVTDISVQPISYNDDADIPRNLKEYRARTIFEWGNPQFTWGDPSCVWNAPGTNIAVRRFPSRTLRCTLKQIEFTNADTIYINSDDFGSLTIDGTANTATIDTGEWPSDMYGFTLYLNGSDSGYVISSQTSTVLTLSDIVNDLVSGSYDTWVIRGKSKFESFYLENYTIVYDMFGPSHTYFRIGDSGENAA